MTSYLTGFPIMNSFYLLQQLGADDVRPENDLEDMNVRINHILVKNGQTPLKITKENADAALNRVTSHFIEDYIRVFFMTKTDLERELCTMLIERK